MCQNWIFDNVAQVKKVTRNQYSGGLADSCWAYAIGTPSDEVEKLMEVTREAMYLGIEQAVVGNRIGDIGAAIQEYAESRGYGVVRDLVGHGDWANNARRTNGAKLWGGWTRSPSQRRNGFDYRAND